MPAPLSDGTTATRSTITLDERSLADLALMKVAATMAAGRLTNRSETIRHALGLAADHLRSMYDDARRMSERAAAGHKFRQVPVTLWLNEAEIAAIAELAPYLPLPTVKEQNRTIAKADRDVRDLDMIMTATVEAGQATRKVEDLDAATVDTPEAQATIREAAQAQMKAQTLPKILAESADGKKTLAEVLAVSRLG